MKRLWILLVLAAFVTPMMAGCQNDRANDDDGARLEVDVDD